jgi:hypothetical protein
LKLLLQGPLKKEKSEFKTSSTPQTNWSHSLSRGTSAPKTSLDFVAEKSDNYKEAGVGFIHLFMAFYGL